MTLVREFNLYLTAGRSIPLVINVNQFDSGEQWAFTIYKEDGTQYIPSTGAIVGIKSDNLGIINSGTVDENGRVIITETQQMTASVGKAVFELTLDSGTHGTANFVVLVEEKPGNNADLSDSDISLIQEALNAVSPLPTGGTVGQVLTKTANGSAWSDAGTPTQEQVAEAVSDWADENITVETGVVIDTSLSVAGAAADAKKTGDEISDLKSEIQLGGSFNAEVKAALETLLENVVYKGDDPTGRTYINTLHNAMYPPTNLDSITAVYTQGGTVYDTDSLDDLKSDLVVTAHYSDSTTAVVTNYVLSGTLVAGTSTITVTYGGKTTTFNVTVTDSRSLPTEYTWLYDARTDGLLSAQNYIDMTVTGTATETLTDGELVINSAVRSDNNSNYIKYALTDTTTTNAVLSCRAKIINTMTSYNTPMGFRLQLSNGTSGAKAHFLDVGNTGFITVVYAEGSTNREAQTTKAINEYHVFELIFADGHQKLNIDGDEIFDTTTLSTPANNSIFNQAGKSTVNPNGVITNIDWVAYYEQ